MQDGEKNWTNMHTEDDSNIDAMTIVRKFEWHDISNNHKTTD